MKDEITERVAWLPSVMLPWRTWDSANTAFHHPNGHHLEKYYKEGRTIQIQIQKVTSMLIDPPSLLMEWYSPLGIPDSVISSERFNACWELNQVSHIFFSIGLSTSGSVTLLVNISNFNSTTTWEILGANLVSTCATLSLLLAVVANGQNYNSSAET
ncbi:hypothetical protein DFH06DRAFT_1136905 [Mycena polygramma]|nr:hypothetical protein DFH06DRAFT_1136905 [Mycena polygramma]